MIKEFDMYPPVLEIWLGSCYVAGGLAWLGLVGYLIDTLND